MTNRFVYLLLSIFLVTQASGQVAAKHDLVFDKLPTRWDEALPLGNAFMGELIWQKGDKLRFSLDHAELWDLRPMVGMRKPEFTYKWVQSQIKKTITRWYSSMGIFLTNASLHRVRFRGLPSKSTPKSGVR